MKDRINKLVDGCEIRKEQIYTCLSYLEKHGYYSAPASSSVNKHNAFNGGLAEHSYLVTDTLLSVRNALIDSLSMPDLNLEQLLSYESCVVAGLFHDAHKCTDGFLRENYVPNVGKSGKVSDAKPYEVNKNTLAFSGAFKSVAIVLKFMSITEPEMQAIAYHDGLYVPAGKEVSMKEHPLTLMLHFADMWSCTLLENAQKWAGYVRGVQAQFLCEG